MEDNQVCKLNVEYHKKSTVLCFIFSSFLVFLVSVILAFILSPNIVESPKLTYDACVGQSRHMCYNQHKPDTSFHFKVDLAKHNQFLYIQADFHSSKSINHALNYSLTIFTNTQEKILVDKETNRVFQLSCRQRSCNSLLLIYVPYIKYEHYIVTFSVYNGLPADSIDLSIRYMTREFTKFFLIIKYMFLAFSAIAILLFIRSLIRVKFRYWPRQSKTIGLMLISLFYFNEPFLALSLNKLSAEWSGVSVFCNTQFVAFLIIFCFLILHNDYPKKRWTITLALESIFVFIFFVLLFSVYMFATVQFKYDPSFNWEHDFPDGQKKVFITVLTFIAAFALWTVYLVCYSVIKLDERLLRDQILTLTVYGILFISFVLIGIGAFQPLPRSGSILLSTVSLYNCYFITLSWLYSPNKMAYDQISMNAEISNSEEPSMKKDENDNTFIINSPVVKEGN